MSIKLSDAFNSARLLRFALPSIVMMVFASVYSVVDGLFVSNFAGKQSLAGVNLIFPLVTALGCAGYMLGTGGAAFVAKVMGEGDQKKANRLFTFFVISAAVIACVLSVVGSLATDPFLAFMGAEGELVELAKEYGAILLLALPFLVLQSVFQSFFVAAEKPHVGLAVMVAGGLANIALDWLFIAVFGWGVRGAALATGIGQVIAGATPILYFAISKTSRLRLAKPVVEMRSLGKACVNGSSELMTEIAASVVSMLYNLQLMNLAGADGVAAYSVIMYVNFVFTAVFFGFAMGTGPVVSFKYGAGDTEGLRGLLRRSMRIVVVFGVAMFALSQVLAEPLVDVFVGYDQGLVDMTLHGFRIYSVAFLVMGVNVYGSAFFTALNNGVVSAVIAFARTLVLETSTVLLLPLWLGVDGVWCAIIVAEGAALVLTVSLLLAFRKRYRY